MLPKSSQRVAVVIKLANQIAREYEQEYVGTEHMLLAILREGTESAQRCSPAAALRTKICASKWPA